MKKTKFEDVSLIQQTVTREGDSERIRFLGHSIPFSDVSNVRKRAGIILNNNINKYFWSFLVYLFMASVLENLIVTLYI